MAAPSSIDPTRFLHDQLAYASAGTQSGVGDDGGKCDQLGTAWLAAWSGFVRQADLCRLMERSLVHWWSPRSGRLLTR